MAVRLSRVGRVTWVDDGHREAFLLANVPSPRHGLTSAVGALIPLSLSPMSVRRTKQLRRNGGGKPTIRLARSSKLERYYAIELLYVSLNNAPVGSSYYDGANRVCRARRNTDHDVNWPFPVIHWNQVSARPSI